MSTDNRLAVRKTYKLFIGGAFPRSESGRSYLVDTQPDGAVANVALASRKDVRDAVLAARAAVAKWSGATERPSATSGPRHTASPWAARAVSP